MKHVHEKRILYRNFFLDNQNNSRIDWNATTEKKLKDKNYKM